VNEHLSAYRLRGFFFSRQLLIRAQPFGLSSSDLWRIRAAIHRAGGIVETVRVNYRNDQIPPQQPKATRCRYYYGSHGNAPTYLCYDLAVPADDLRSDREAVLIPIRR